MLRAELGGNYPAGPRPFPLGPHVYAGPTFLSSFGKLWWSTGVYVRATDFDRTPQAGEGFGPVWFRSIVGVSL